MSTRIPILMPHLVLALSLASGPALAQHLEDNPPEAYQDPRHTGEEQHDLQHDHESPLPEFAENPVSGTSEMDANPFPLPHMMDRSPLAMVMIDELEWRDTDAGDAITWDAEAWWGNAIHRAWFKTEGERADGEFEELELQLLYSRAVSPFWNLQAGLRHDLEPDSRTWGVLTLEGLAPYWFETELSLFIGEGGQAELRLEAEYEILFTQRLILSPEIELSAFADDEPELGIGSGLASAELGARLRYEIHREFAPYIGFSYERLFGDSADFAEGGDKDDFTVLAGLRVWF